MVCKLVNHGNRFAWHFLFYQIMFFISRMKHQPFSIRSGSSPTLISFGILINALLLSLTVLKQPPQKVYLIGFLTSQPKDFF
jgi:hypothetical protein